MRVIYVKGCRDCPKLKITGCGYDCYYCQFKPNHLRQLIRQAVDAHVEYVDDRCPLDEVL